MALVTYGLLSQSYPQIFDCNASQSEREQWEDLCEVAEDFFCAEHWGLKRQRILTYWLLAQKELQKVAKMTMNGSIQAIAVTDEGSTTFVQNRVSKEQGFLKGLDQTYYGGLVLTMYKVRFPMGQYVAPQARGRGVVYGSH